MDNCTVSREGADARQSENEGEGTMRRYYAMQYGGPLCKGGGPATLCRFATRQERDNWLDCRNLAEPVTANHLWVKQANWRIREDGGPKNWTSCAILTVSYDMTV